MHALNFFPLGNADCCRVDLKNGRTLLFDYADVGNPDDEDDLRIDLATVLREQLDAAEKNAFDVVAFTHLDTDHVKGASEFFWFEHAAKYQADGRVRIDELWVPAAAVTESGCEGDAAVIQAEAKHRLRQKKGIRVFSRPQALKGWLDEEGISIDDVRDLITDAGQVVPGFSTTADGVEWFTHSPFARRQDDDEVVDRNLHSLVVQGRFTADGAETKLILGADVDHECLAEIVQITRAKERDERLEWDIFKLPHHCSYTALGPEKGDEVTEPVADVEWLFEEAGQAGGLIISTSKPIPSHDEDDQPPHRQAARYYQSVADENDGEFVVTMEHPRESSPETLVVRIDRTGATLEKRMAGVSAAVLTQRAPRAG